MFNAMSRFRVNKRALFGIAIVVITSIVWVLPALLDPWRAKVAANAWLSQSTEYWSTIPAPTHAPVVYQRGLAQDSDYTWKYPYTRPSPAGVIRVSNTLVDSDGKYGKWSAVRELTVKSGWRLWGGSWNLPIVEDCSGIMWRLEIVSIEEKDDWQYNPYKPGRIAYLYTNWGGSYLQNEISPVSGFSPYLQQLTEDAWSYYTLEKFSGGGTFQSDAPAPVVVPNNIPNKTYELAYCRVAEDGGETALSPAYTYVPSPLPDGTFPAEASWLRCVIHEYHPQGTVGLHFYRRELIKPAVKATETAPEVPAEWGSWRRLPDAECYGTPNGPDDWLWPIWKRQLFLLRYVDDAPTHKASVNPQSRLSTIHRLLRGDPTKDKEVLFKYFQGPDKVVKNADGSLTVRPTYNEEYVQVDEATGQPVAIKKTFVGDVVVPPGSRFAVHCPVIDEWGNGDTGTTGAPPDQKFRRRIRAADFGQWTIEQRQSRGGHLSWPVLLIHNSYSKWTGAAVVAMGGDALTYSDYSGGQAFGNQFDGCRFEAPMTMGRVTCGIRMDAACAPSHHPSEQLFHDCYASGGIAVMLSGIQSANVRFDRLHASSNSDERGSVFYVSNPNPLKFLNGCFADAYIRGVGGSGVIFRVNDYQATLQVGDIWIDTGFRRFVESNNAATQLTLTDGKLNVRGAKPALGLILGNPRAKSTWLMTGTQVQQDPQTQAPRIISHSYRMMEPLYERTLLNNLVLKEPSDATASAMFKRFSNANLVPVEETGYKSITDYNLSLDVPTMVIRPRTQAEIDEAYLPLSKIPNLPAWGKTFFRQHYLKYVIEPKTVTITTKGQSVRYSNSLTTGAKVTREDLLNPVAVIQP